MPIKNRHFSGVGEKIRTSAALTNPTGLANPPLQPLGYTYILFILYKNGGEGGIRTHGRL